MQVKATIFCKIKKAKIMANTFVIFLLLTSQLFASNIVLEVNNNIYWSELSYKTEDGVALVFENQSLFEYAGARAEDNSTPLDSAQEYFKESFGSSIKVQDAQFSAEVYTPNNEGDIVERSIVENNGSFSINGFAATYNTRFQAFQVIGNGWVEFNLPYSWIIQFDEHYEDGDIGRGIALSTLELYNGTEKSLSSYYHEIYESELGNTYSDNGILTARLDFLNGGEGYFKISNEAHPSVIDTTPPSVPIASAGWLLGSGLVGYIGVRMKFKNKKS